MYKRENCSLMLFWEPLARSNRAALVTAIWSYETNKISMLCLKPSQFQLQYTLWKKQDVLCKENMTSEGLFFSLTRSEKLFFPSIFCELVLRLLLLNQDLQDDDTVKDKHAIGIRFELIVMICLKCITDRLLMNFYTSMLLMCGIRFP